MSATVQLIMRANLVSFPYSVVTWTVYNQPDNTGAQSGYPLGSLTNIGVDYISNSGQSVNPLVMTVSGDLTGSLPNPNVVKLQGNAISVTAPTSGQNLTWNGTAWTPTDPTVTTTVGGDLSGTLPNPTVVKLRGESISATSPTAGQNLTFDGYSWIPTTPTSAFFCYGNITNPAGVPAIVASSNIASVSAQSGPSIRITFTTHANNANYIVSGTTTPTNTSDSPYNFMYAFNKTTSSVDIGTYDAFNGTLAYGIDFTFMIIQA